MPTQGEIFPDIAATEYTRQPRLIQTRVDVPFGDPQINVPHPFPKEFMSWNSTFLKPADIDALEKWFKKNGTTFFSFYDAPGWGVRAVPKTTIGAVQAGVLTYTLKAKALTGLVVYNESAGGAVVNASTYVYNEGAGPEGEGQIVFNVGQLPPVGNILSFDATTGRRKFLVWCLNEQFPGAYTGEGDLFTLEEPLRFEEKIV